MSDNAVRRAWRSASLGAVTRLVGGRPAALPPWEDGAPRRVLFLRYDKIGDMLMSTAVLRAIAGSHPALTLDVLASPASAPVLDGIPGLGEVIVHAVRGTADALRFGRTLRPRRYDAVVDGLVLIGRVNAVTAMLMAGVGAPVRIGMGGARQQTLVYTHRVPPPPDPARAHHVCWLAQLAGAFGVEPRAVGRPTLALSAGERQRAALAWGGAPDAPGPAGGARPQRLLVNVSAGTWHRRWPDERFGEVLADVKRRHPDVRVCVTGEPRERAAVEALARAAGALAPPTPSLRDALALVSAADVVLTPDTAVGHAASAFQKRCVAMLLPGTERFRPYDTPGEVLVSPGPTLPSLPAEPVLAALDRVLADPGHPAQQPADGGEPHSRQLRPVG